MRSFTIPIFLIALMSTFHLAAQNAPDRVIPVWPGPVPGEADPKANAEVSNDHSGDVTRLSRVTEPVLEVFAPAAGKANGAAVIVCPGGGYRILAIDKEGYEIAAWLADMGYTAFVLQYRVPGNREGALQDLQRSVRLVRDQAGAMGLDPAKLAVLGFSAGGHLAASAASFEGEATYAPYDGADKLSPIPDAAVLLYPAYLDEGPDKGLSEGISLGPDSPPFFLFVASDDSYSHSSMVMAEALRAKKASVEFHMVSAGGHGYGMRSGNPAAETWPALAEAWLAAWLDK